MYTNSKKQYCVIPYLVIAAVLTLSALLLKFYFDKYISVFKAQQTFSQDFIKSIVIDAGHGGKDGGAVSVTGTAEKELNLSVSSSICELMHLFGYNTVMTRTEDVELSCPEIGGTRKMQDLMGRYIIASNHPTATFVSIHMNKFPIERYSGLQVYYSKNNLSSKELARSVQKSVKDLLQNDNDRVTKPATSSIYLLDKITSPAILIECGFISNNNESKLLESCNYRKELSVAIALPIISMKS